MNIVWIALTVIASIALIFAVAAFVVLAEYLQKKEEANAKNQAAGKR